MWDLDTIKEINKCLPRKHDTKHMSKLWRYFDAWRKHLFNKKKKIIWDTIEWKKKAKGGDGEFHKISLKKLEDLPPEIYKELVERSLALATRIKERSDKLKSVIGITTIEGSEAAEDAFWRTASIEQLAFFEMQINNIHTCLEDLINTK